MYSVFIRNNKTREIREYKDDWEWDDGLEYLWSEGNYGCDCNRALFFARAIGEVEPQDIPCGESLYDIVKIQLKDGRIIYEEGSAYART